MSTWSDSSFCLLSRSFSVWIYHIAPKVKLPKPKKSYMSTYIFQSNHIINVLEMQNRHWCSYQHIGSQCVQKILSLPQPVTIWICTCCFESLHLYWYDCYWIMCCVLTCTKDKQLQALNFNVRNMEENVLLGCKCLFATGLVTNKGWS